MTLANVTIANKLPAFFAGQDRTKVGLVVVQEWWGLNEWMKTITEKFASSGVAAVCPDLYHGKVANNEKEASHLMSHLDWDEALGELQSAVDWLKTEKKVEKVVVMGFCMGGALTISAGACLKNLDGGACFYGVPPSTVALPKNITCKMQFHFGELDECKGFSDQEVAHKLEREVKTANVPYEFFHYPQCKHAFMNQLRPNYNQQAADVAFERVLLFCKGL